MGMVHRRSWCKSFANLFRNFQLSDRHRLDFSAVSLWTLSNLNGSSISYIDRVFVRSEHRDSVDCLQFKLVGYTDLVKFISGISYP